jgi:hypothetical protein
MGDKKMTFEEWKEKHNYLIENVAITFFIYGKRVDTKTCYDELEYLLKRAFKAGRPKWHKVADDDYPPCENDNHYSINVLTDSGDIAYYDYNDDYWAEEPASVEIDPPIAWCEIPKYTEADK